VNEFLKLVYLSIAVGAISLVITKSQIFNAFHAWLEKRSLFLEDMLSCPWCTSHWVSLFFVLVYHPLVVNVWAPLDYFVSIMIVVALSSITARLIWSAYKPMMG
jgi:hypothetical protein